jgi:hypothetical protein
MENLRQLTLSEYRKYKSLDDKMAGSAEWIMFKQAFEKGYNLAEATRGSVPDLSTITDKNHESALDFVGLIMNEEHVKFYKNSFIRGFKKHREIFKNEHR